MKGFFNLIIVFLTIYQLRTSNRTSREIPSFRAHRLTKNLRSPRFFFLQRNSSNHSKLFLNGNDYTKVLFAFLTSPSIVLLKNIDRDFYLQDETIVNEIASNLLDFLKKHNGCIESIQGKYYNSEEGVCFYMIPFEKLINLRFGFDYNFFMEVLRMKAYPSYINLFDQVFSNRESLKHNLFKIKFNSFDYNLRFLTPIKTEKIPENRVSIEFDLLIELFTTSNHKIQEQFNTVIENMEKDNKRVTMWLRARAQEKDYSNIDFHERENLENNQGKTLYWKVSFTEIIKVVFETEVEVSNFEDKTRPDHRGLKDLPWWEPASISFGYKKISRNRFDKDEDPFLRWSITNEKNAPNMQFNLDCLFMEKYKVLFSEESTYTGPDSDFEIVPNPIEEGTSRCIEAPQKL